jgi:hypothetical protein
MSEPSTIKPTLFRLALEHTPSPSDPEGAADFYQAIGTLIVAWGRLETHFLACIMVILQLNATKKLSKKLPNAWDERANIWTKASHFSPELKPHEAAALKFLDEMQDVAEVRNLVVHGLWKEFNKGPPISTQVIRIKRHKGIPRGIEFFKSVPLTPDLLRTVTQKASDLNIELQKLSAILQDLHGPPPPDIHILE